jgi:long-chain acyl-CoA synthetase
MSEGRFPAFHTASRTEFGRSLIGPGGTYELAEEPVLGETMAVFAHRARNIYDLFTTGAQTFPDNEYLADPDRRLTFAETGHAVNVLARSLREDHGVQPGDRVAILSANSMEWVVAFWAGLATGAIVAAMNSFWSEPELAAALDLAEPVVVLGDAKRLASIGRVTPTTPCVEMTPGWLTGLLTQPESPIQTEAPTQGLPVRAEDDPAVLIFTSGTTGRPKAVSHSHRGLVGYLQCNMFNGSLRVGRDFVPPPGRVLVSPPLFHLSSLYGALIMQTVFGGLLVIRPGRFDEVTTMRAIESERVSLWLSLGSGAPRVAEHPELPRYDLSSLKSIVVGGAPVSPPVKRLLLEAFPSAETGFRMGYTSSEGGSIVASIGGAEFHAFPESTGPIQDGVEVQIRGEDGKPVPPGQEGEVHVRSAYLMLGYWNDSAATDKVFSPGRWLNMGDVARLDDGRLYVNSRSRDLIFVSAENVYPSEVEYRLDAHPAVFESTVAGIDDPLTGQAIKAFVVLRAGKQATESDLADWCRQALPPYKVPTSWRIGKDPLPRNAAGKVLRNLLVAQDGSGQSSAPPMA